MLFTGFYNVPHANLSTCAVPKGGSSMMRTIVARAVGALPDDNCNYEWGRDRDEALRLRGVTTTYEPTLTTILQIRNPWTRAVSQFADQIRRQHVHGDPRSVRDFMRYLDENTTAWPHRHHTGTASMYCPGLADARFDHIIDVEDISSFHRVATRVPAFGRVVSTGWARCTGGVESLYMVGSVAPHRSAPKLASTLCTSATIRRVCDIYRDDYRLYARLGHPYPCACEQTVVAPE